MCNLARTCQTLHRNHYLFKLLMKLTCWRFLLYQGFGQRQRAPSSRWRCQACNLQTYPKTILSYEWRLLGLEAMRDLKISYHRLDSNPSLAPEGFNAKLSLPNCKSSAQSSARQKKDSCMKVDILLYDDCHVMVYFNILRISLILCWPNINSF